MFLTKKNNNMGFKKWSHQSTI